MQLKIFTWDSPCPKGCSVHPSPGQSWLYEIEHQSLQNRPIPLWSHHHYRENWPTPLSNFGHAKIPARDTSSGPLFIYSSGTALTKTALVSETRDLLSRSGFNSSHYAAHNYRIGAATTAASAGFPAWLIKTMGRWSSDCYERYVRVAHSILSDVSKTLASKTHL